MMMHRNRSASAHEFAMVPRAEIPRASFKMSKAYKTTLDAGWLIPIFCEEVLPGDTWKVRMTAFARLATPLYPIMDNLHLESFFFFVPNRLVWANWERFMGQQDNPGDSISYVVPKFEAPVGGFPEMSIADYLGLPCAGQCNQQIQVNALPFRAYAIIFNEWFRDENLRNRMGFSTGDGPDTFSLPAWALRPRGKRHDYFTSCLPWPQKGNTAVSIPLGTYAPVITRSTQVPVQTLGVQANFTTSGASATANKKLGTGPASGDVSQDSTNITPTGNTLYWGNMWADLSTATAATINQLRQAFQIQKLLERDARGGTRYIEIVRSHFGVISPDARLQRPEYLGGGYAPILINPIAQTSATGISGGSTPAGNLAAMGTGLASGHGFSQSFTEHGYIMGIVCIRADLTYQQGLRRHWSRNTRYDYYFPAFAMLGEQAVLSKEIYCTGGAGDDDVFGYQERWAEYRYLPSEITGKFRSTHTAPLDAWHLAQRFASRPVLDATFVSENPPMERVLALGGSSVNQEFLVDALFETVVARPMPLYSVPGLIDHF